ncbi:DUF5787 family protein [Halosimplex halophilum]|uniref:DUF5787 family protein n=1 Tax=Halosimplex halophilum TaxID=2559572 RepID=UPI001FE443C1|nr:DUF5787 family protein [Halosimplex halophilum]
MSGADDGVTGQSEFVFELAVCQWAEREWPPAGSATGAGDGDGRPTIVARQIGTKRRRWDTVVVECDPEGLARRANFGLDELDSDLLHVVRNAPAEWAWYRDALPDPGYPWRYVREAVHEAADRGLVERRRRSNSRIEIRRKWTYPDWVERVVAIENKPDLDASAARELGPQLERDVALALADEVWVATTETGETVEPALVEDVPVEAGVLTVDAAGEAAVSWHPRTLAVDDPGTRILERPPGGDRDASAARFEYADPEWKADKRLELAERAYGRGWRAYADTMRPDCRHFRLTDAGAGFLPRCAAKECHPTAGECSGSCPEFEPEPPAWRSNGWPVSGGPGKGIKRLLERQRRRQRPGLDEEP